MELLIHSNGMIEPQRDLVWVFIGRLKLQLTLYSPPLDVRLRPEDGPLQGPKHVVYLNKANTIYSCVWLT
jgi:hypothetical protein